MNAATPFPFPINTAETNNAETGLRLLFENAPFGMAHCSSDGGMIVLNPALEQILGSSRPTRVSRFGDLVDCEDRTATEAMFREMVEGGRKEVQFEGRGFRCDGTSAPVKWTAWRVSASAGHPAFGLAMAGDFAGQNAPPEFAGSGSTSQALRQADRLEAVGRLAGGVAHDFNNLLTGIILYCDLLLAGLESGHRLHIFAEEIRAAGMQATGLVRQLLDVARLQTQQPRPVSLNQVVQETRNLLVRLIGENITLHFQLDPNLGLVMMDPGQVQQIFLNLVLNARDAMPGGGQIKIETSNCALQVTAGQIHESAVRPVPCALFVVSDNGKGMNAETRKHLFEAFFTTKSAGQGTGLGLATVYNIVTGSGGLIHADSESGRGTRMTVILPLVPDTILAEKIREEILHPDKSSEITLHPDTPKT